MWTSDDGSRHDPPSDGLTNLSVHRPGWTTYQLTTIMDNAMYWPKVATSQMAEIRLCQLIYYTSDSWACDLRQKNQPTIEPLRGKTHSSPPQWLAVVSVPHYFAVVTLGDPLLRDRTNGTCDEDSEWLLWLEPCFSSHLSYRSAGRGLCPLWFGDCELSEVLDSCVHLCLAYDNFFSNICLLIKDFTLVCRLHL